MKINMDTVMPHADFNRMMGNAMSITIIANGQKHTGEMDMSIDDNRNLVITVGNAPKTKAKAKAK